MIVGGKLLARCRIVTHTAIVILIAAARGNAAYAEAPQAANVTRADLGLAYLQLERALRDNPPMEEAQRREIHRGFDEATLDFFRGNMPRALRSVKELAARVDPQPGSRHRRTQLDSIKVLPTPLVFSKDARGPLQFKLRSMYSVDSASAMEVAVRLRRSDGIIAANQTIQLNVTPKGSSFADFVFEGDIAALTDGAYWIGLTEAGGTTVQVGRCIVVPRSLLSLREDLLKRLDDLAAKGVPAEFSTAFAICRDRVILLTDVMRSSSSGSLLFDPVEIYRDVDADISALEQQRDPYPNRAGDYWRTIQVQSGPVPTRWYVPERPPAQPRAVVIALHGAGGDENMFLAGYGAGRIREIADDRNLIVIAPRTTLFSVDAFDALRRELTKWDAIDLRRIYLLGHSMGAPAAMGLANIRGPQIASVCCIAGGGAPGRDIPHTLIIAAEEDPLFSHRAIEATTQRAKADGAPVEFLLKKSMGHTLVVGSVLVDAVDWLLQRQLPAQP